MRATTTNERKVDRWQHHFFRRQDQNLVRAWICTVDTQIAITSGPWLPVSAGFAMIRSDTKLESMTNSMISQRVVIATVSLYTPIAAKWRVD